MNNQPSIEIGFETKKGSFSGEGTYPEMVVGRAFDLYGHGESAEAEFSFRASGGKSIKDGTAYVKEIHGNAVVWNQMAKPFQNADIKPSISGITYHGNDITIVNFEEHRPFRFNISFTKTIGHQYLLLLDYANTSVDQKILIQKGSSISWQYSIGNIVRFFTNSETGTGAYEDYLSIYLITATEGSITLSNLNLYDLTKMFGAGNEPSTIEDFYRLLPTNIDISAYNEGQVIPFNANGIKSVGDNAWDEQWEKGTIVDNTGALVNSEKTIRSKNYIKVIGGQEYRFAYFGSAVTWERIFYYDSDKALLYSAAISVNKNFTPPSNCAYIKFRIGDNYGTTYKNDITISLYHSGWKAEVDNTYKPYWEDTLMLDARIKEAFPNGMYRAGSAYDIVRYNAETKEMEGVKMIGEANMWELPWSYIGANETYPYGRMSCALDGRKIDRGNLLCSVYANQGASYTTDKNIFGAGTASTIIVIDSAYTDVATFKAMLQEKQVKLYYELAEPIVTPLGEFEMDYKVADFGTEEIIGSEPSAPFSGRTIYQFNAVDQIRENYNEIERIKAALAKAGITI